MNSFGKIAPEEPTDFHEDNIPKHEYKNKTMNNTSRNLLLNISACQNYAVSLRDSKLFVYSIVLKNEDHSVSNNQDNFSKINIDIFSMNNFRIQSEIRSEIVSDILEGDTPEVMSACISADNKLGFGCKFNMIYIVDGKSNKLLHSTELSKTYISRYTRYTLDYIDQKVKSVVGNVLGNVLISSFINVLCFSTDNKFLAAGSSSGCIFLYQIIDGEPNLKDPVMMKGHKSSVEHIKFINKKNENDKKDNIFLISSDKSSIRLWATKDNNTKVINIGETSVFGHIKYIDATLADTNAEKSHSIPENDIENITIEK